MAAALLAAERFLGAAMTALESGNTLVIGNDPCFVGPWGDAECHVLSALGPFTDGPVAAFAADLRVLRARAGSPGYRELAVRAEDSAAALANAAGGRRLPSLAVTLAFVRACDGDPAVWEQRWRHAAAESSTTPAEPVEW